MIRYDIHVGGWVSEPLDLTYMPATPGILRTFAIRALDRVEDVELCAAELGITRGQLYARF